MSAAKQDQLAIIRIEGLHCHTCEQQIQQALSALPGVHEVEVDFPSAQVSVLYSDAQIHVDEFMKAIQGMGYKATSLLQNQASQTS